MRPFLSHMGRTGLEVPGRYFRGLQSSYKKPLLLSHVEGACFVGTASVTLPRSEQPSGDRILRLVTLVCCTPEAKPLGLRLMIIASRKPSKSRAVSWSSKTSCTSCPAGPESGLEWRNQDGVSGIDATAPCTTIEKEFRVIMAFGRGVVREPDNGCRPLDGLFLVERQIPGLPHAVNEARIKACNNCAYCQLGRHVEIGEASSSLSLP